LRERAVVVKHALKNAILPVITIIGTEFAFLIGGHVVTDNRGPGMLLVKQCHAQPRGAP
jgi:peptide/nickel transport system permease protein